MCSQSNILHIVVFVLRWDWRVVQRSHACDGKLEEVLHEVILVKPKPQREKTNKFQ